MLRYVAIVVGIVGVACLMGAMCCGLPMMAASYLMEGSTRFFSWKSFLTATALGASLMLMVAGLTALIGWSDKARDVVAAVCLIALFASISSAAFTSGLGYFYRNERELDRWITSLGTGKGLASILIVVGPILALFGFLPLTLWANGKTRWAIFTGYSIALPLWVWITYDSPDLRGLGIAVSIGFLLLAVMCMNFAGKDEPNLG